jgi:hypothetical protein
VLRRSSTRYRFWWTSRIELIKYIRRMVPKKVPRTIPATPPLVMPEQEGTEVGVDWRAERGGEREGGGRYWRSVSPGPSGDAS